MNTGNSVASAQAAIKSLAVICLTIGLTACGGGGGGSNVRPPNPPPTAPPPTPPVVGEPNPAYSRHLAVTNAYPALEAGLTGAGIRIGVIDTGVNRNHPALQGRVTHNLNYVSSPPNNLAVDDVVGHGTAVSLIMAGKPFGNWPGGVAPGASIISARIISDERPVDDGTGQGNEVNGALGLAPIHQDLINRGARIMNNSWGGLYWTNPAATAPIANEYRPFIIGNDGLVVFATGNSSFADPSDMAALPSQLGPDGSRPAADLERGWLAVAAVDTDNPSQLASYSNACGIAMHYCLAAPGAVVVPGTNDSPTTPTYWNWTGTSLAAPLVSGAAALVWEAFPYFNNDLVRQTLLGTATDWGELGVDPVFGYGVLDIGSAVHGPAQFNWGDVVADFDGITSVWSNTISGDGGLIKRGTGTLILEHYYASGYRGDTRIEEGTLIANGPLANTDVYVGANGTLTGDGDIFGTLVNAGTVVTDDDDNLLVLSDYTQSAGGTLSVQLGTLFTVYGVATIEGGTLHVSGVKPGYVTQSREAVLGAIGGLSGRFDALTSASNLFLEATFEYDYVNYDVWLNISRLDVAAAARSFANITTASLASAERIETAFDQIDAQRSEKGNSIAEDFVSLAGDFQQSSSEAEAKASLASLSGELHASADAMTFDAIDMNRRALSSHFGSLAGQSHRSGDWFQRLGNRGQGSYGAADFDVDGWMLGSDQWLGERFGVHGVAGFAFGETRAHSRVDGNRDRSQDRQTQGQFYLGGLRGSAYALGQIGFGRYDRQMRRELLLGERYHGVASEYSGDYVSANLETGYRFGTHAMSLTPYLGAEHARINRDGFAEAGASGFGLRTDASVGERTQAIAGARVEREWTGRGGRAFALRGYAEWQQTLDASGFDIDASFVGVEAWSPLVGTDPMRSGGVFGFGLESRLSDAARLSFGYDQRFGPRDAMRMVSAQFSLGF